MGSKSPNSFWPLPSAKRAPCCTFFWPYFSFLMAPWQQKREYKVCNSAFFQHWLYASNICNSEVCEKVPFLSLLVTLSSKAHKSSQQAFWTPLNKTLQTSVCTPHHPPNGQCPFAWTTFKKGASLTSILLEAKSIVGYVLESHPATIFDRG